MPPAPAQKDLVGLAGLPREEIVSILDEAAEMKRRLGESGKALDDLGGRTACLLFFEPSTRTMNAFAAAARNLSADVMAVSAGKGTSVSKGETFLDTARNLEAIGTDVFVVRHGSSGAPHRLAPLVRAGVVSGGDGWHEHPTQALLDMFTLRERFGKVEGLEVAIVGDIRHSRVARSNCFGLVTCGAKVTLVAPPAWMPEGAETLGAAVSHSIDDVLPRMDAVMALRIQKERLGGEPGPSGAAYAAEYGLTRERMARAKAECAVLHPGPINRGIEMTSEVADSAASLILDQVANGVHVRMAVLARSVRAARGMEGGAA
ncbi:MAG: aspartate carbamoyltransferase catalytic subunit [Planctomycetota bacterium]|jgi:aspartate carbamoyltransferase catalytic subunit